MEDAARPILLNARGASTCARATHNRFDRTIDAEPWVVPETLQARFDAGITFEAETVVLIKSRAGNRVLDLNDLDGEPRNHVTATVKALTDGVPVIVGGRLPEDLAGGRVGKPDLLILAGATSDGRPGYVPGDIKAHRAATKGKGPLAWSTWSAPAPDAARSTDGLRADFAGHQADALQLAHYWRMLEAAGFSADRTPIGAIVGTDVLDGVDLVLAWYDLDAPSIWTYSRSQGRRKRSVMERYDHEHEFRMRVARLASQRRGVPEGSGTPGRTGISERVRWLLMARRVHAPLG